MLQQLILAVAIVVAAFYYVFIKPTNYWRGRGVQQADSAWVFGENWNLVTKKESYMEMVLRWYRTFPGTRYHGIYQGLSPSLVIKDPELVKQITVSDFEYFTDHKTVIPEDSDPIWGNTLFALKGKKWREMRSILSPSFTSSKMRTMFVLMSECAEKFVNHFLNENEDCIEIEMKESFTRFTTDAIATTAFGVEVDSIGEPNNTFYKMGKEVSELGGIVQIIKFFGAFLFPRIYKYFNISFASKRSSRFFSDLVEETVKTRESNNIIRPDMIHLLIEAKKGNQQVEENIATDTGFAAIKEVDLGRVPTRGITNKEIISQAFIFFIAGFDSIASLLSFTSYELAVNPKIQKKLRKEVEETLAKCKGKVTYEALMEMKYMDMVVSESLRLWPSAPAGDRVCTKPYVVEPVNPNEKPLYIEKNTYIMIPIIGIHRDPQYYQDPDRFDPERFNDENKGSIKPSTYLPFGIGPRGCIASRLSLLEGKILLFHLLANFELVPVGKTPIPMRISKQNYSLDAEGGIWLGWKRLKNMNKDDNF